MQTPLTQLCDTLTEKICDAVREMPGTDSGDVIAMEVIIACQLITGLRGVAADDAITLIYDAVETLR